MTIAARDAGPARRGSASAAARSTGSKKAAAKSRSGESGPARTRRGSASPEAKPVRAVLPVAGGLLWAVALVGSVAVSSFLTAVLLGVVAVVATASGMRASETGPRGRSRSKSRSRRPPTVLVLALGAAALDPLVALAGPFAAVAVLLVSEGVVGAMVLSSGYAASARPLRSVGSRLVAAIGPAVAATSVVIARHQGSTLALALVTAVLAYDAGSFLMGNSRTPLGGPVGVTFGVISVAVVAVFVAAVMNPPFNGSRPWIVFALVAAACPMGVRLGQLLGKERLPAVRRMDSLLVTAPLWVLSAALLLHR